ncbi:YceI family protein [Marixanthomonas ophiurae]|uniref:YceI family protein n=1 Tax=Marixanthomonas ophiurae TaxID=387659 RepID=A0A3E1QDL4_9FLAO|nr:YceI family protein [Marixanthomonas ophiurae]
MKYALLFTLTLTTIVSAQNSMEKETIYILKNSKLTITGDTNINKFRCEFDTTYLVQNKEINYINNGDEINFKNAVLTLQNECFDCGSKAINRDFHSLLKSEKYPEITLELNYISLNDKERGIAHVIITISEKEKEYTFPIDISSSSTNCFSGKLKMNIKDFGLEPPKKLFGLIIIKEEVEINFNLAIEI